MKKNQQLVGRTTCPANACAAVNDNWRTTRVAVNLLGVHFQQTLLLFLPNQEHEVEKGSCRVRHSVVRPASELQMGYITRLQRLQQS